MSDVYVVRLYPQHFACLQSFANNLETVQPLRIALVVLVDSARPAHPERQAVLEELAEAVTATPINLDWIHRIKRRLRSLEGK